MGREGPLEELRLPGPFEDLRLPGPLDEDRLGGPGPRVAMGGHGWQLWRREAKERWKKHEETIKEK